MITFMFDILCVTNRRLCGDFLAQIETIAMAKPSGIILREKDLNEADYGSLSKQVIKICKQYEVPCILHSFADIAVTLNSDKIHLPLPVLRTIPEVQKSRFKRIGSSCHSVEEAVEAQKLGCTYITAGHIFATDCKKDIAPRGIDFLNEVCRTVSIPVYAIGGIDSSKVKEVKNAGAAGVCIMSGLMKCENVQAYIQELKKETQ
jgi:thiamine-phosphate pyrophosphorylase